MLRSSDLARRIDQWVGGVIARGLGKGGRPWPTSPKRIILIQPTAIGDTLIASGAIAAIVDRWPDADIVLVHGSNNAAAVKLISAAVRPVRVDFGRPIGALRALRAMKADVVIDLTPWPYATALVARLSGAWTAGFQPAFGRRGAVFDLAIAHRTDRHEIDNLIALADTLGTAQVPRKMAVTRDPAAGAASEDEAGLILCHACPGGARAQAKSWPISHWARLTKGLVEDGWQLGFTGVAADAKIIGEIIAEADVPRGLVHDLCGKISLADLAGRLAETPLLISVDTGVLHLSAAMEGRALGLHGPTLSRRWGSVSPAAKGLDAPHAAAGFVNYGWEDHPDADKIMETLSPDAVLAEARAMLTQDGADT